MWSFSVTKHMRGILIFYVIVVYLGSSKSFAQVLLFFIFSGMFLTIMDLFKIASNRVEEASLPLEVKRKLMYNIPVTTPMFLLDI